jgi:hypothetical protein
MVVHVEKNASKVYNWVANRIARDKMLNLAPVKYIVKNSSGCYYVIACQPKKSVI